MSDKFTVEKVIVPKAGSREATCFFILDNGIPDYLINSWLELKGIHSELTSRQYAYNLVRFLNYLNFLKKDYKDAIHSDVLAYMSLLLFGGDSNVLKFTANIMETTCASYLNTIKEFYRHLEDSTNEGIELRINKGAKRSAKHSYLYGQIWDMDTAQVLQTQASRRKNPKDYIRWYTDEEKAIILSNLTTKRDKSIFLLSLEGMRIDEILSLNLNNYEPSKCVIKTSRSKGRKKRVVPLRKKTIHMLEDYIFTERNKAETETGITDKLFLNIRAGSSYGKPVQYRNILQVFKSAAKRGNIDPKMIRTHSGRSSRTMELIQYQTEHPDANLTDEQILLLMGWSSESSMKPYVNYSDERVLLASMNKMEGNSD